MIANSFLSDIVTLLPEICLLLTIVTLQITNVTFPSTSRITAILVATALLFSIYMLNITEIFGSAFGGSYLLDKDSATYKAYIFIMTLCVTLFYVGYSKYTEQKFQSEYLSLILLCTIGASLAISARDLIVLFVSLELQALSAYILAGFDRESRKSSEASVKYFILGAISSCIMLFGMSMLYGITGSTLYDEILVKYNSLPDLLFAMSMFLIFVAMMFKLSIAPFHFWTADVYEGAPIVSVSFFGSILKLGSFVGFVNLFFPILNNSTHPSLSHFLEILAILSMIVGAFGALMQQNIKRLMAYSTILNMGYAIIPMTFFSREAVGISFTYIVIYAFSSMGLFAAIAAAFGKKAENLISSDMNGMASAKPILSITISIILFSMTGLPPFAGFFGKYYIIVYAIKNEQYLLSFAIITSSVIAAYYYINIIRAMYFLDYVATSSNRKYVPELSSAISISLLFIVFFSIIA